MVTLLVSVDSLPLAGTALTTWRTVLVTGLVLPSPTSGHPAPPRLVTRQITLLGASHRQVFLRPNEW